MALDIACPACGERDDLSGHDVDDERLLECGACEARWTRSSGTRCERCGSSDLQVVPLAIVERSRGTQLSVVGTRPVSLCSVCDASTLAGYHAHRPNPLMPTELPTVGEEQMNG